jgi:hypothetical protein
MMLHQSVLKVDFGQCLLSVGDVVYGEKSLAFSHNAW